MVEKVTGHDKAAIGALLTKMREAAGIKSFTEAAPIAGATRQKVSEMEQGKGYLAPLLYAVRLARKSPDARGLLISYLDPSLADVIDDADAASIVTLLRDLRGHPERRSMVRGIEQMLEAMKRSDSKENRAPPHHTDLAAEA